MPNKLSDKSSKLSLVDEWIKKAEDDHLFAKSISTHRDAPPSGVCFHCQQMAEKLFKAFLIFQGKQYPKIHAVDALWEMCVEIDTSLKELKEDAVYLTGFYVTTRYPGDYPDFSWREAELALTAALNIKDVIIKKIKI